MCGVQGDYYGPLEYQWTSTCAGGCFVLGSTQSNISVTAIRSTDFGTHTCSVVDAVGNTGMATVQMNVYGKEHTSIVMSTLIIIILSTIICAIEILKFIHIRCWHQL